MKLGNLFRRISILLFVVVMGVTIYNQQVTMNRIKSNISLQTQELEKAKAENEILTHSVELTKTDEFIIKNARTRLGLLKPGEIPVIDSSN
ncbi:MAG TPA: septum formation initiator family protein [Clostridiaceae bacterium]|nr:septum formation initiator family protein [Clostridiaceae bacterium]